MADVKLIGDGIPQIGYGTWNRDAEATFEGVTNALDIGYRHIDTAEGYNNEEHVGRAIDENAVSRDEIFLTTKIAPESFGPGQIMGHVETSLEKLRTDQVDLLLLHYPSIGDEYDIKDYMAQFVEVFDKGLTKRIGVSNFTIRYIDTALELLGDHKISTNQIEIHPLMQNYPIVDHCLAKGIPLTAYSPLARGAVADSAVLKNIGQAHGMTPQQIALAFLMHEGYVVIPSAGAHERIASNFEAKDVILNEEEMAKIRGVDQNLRLVNGSWCPEWDEY